VVRVLVTGSQGYVGAVLCPRLAAQGAEVVGCDAGWFAAAQVAHVTPARFHDLRTLTQADLEGIDAILHLAGLSNDPLGEVDAAATDTINRADTLELARKSAGAGVSTFVFASSCSVYGESGEVELDEAAPPAPLTPYAAAKHAAEQELLALHAPGFRVAILRGATVFGASPCPRTDLLLNELCATAACNEPFVMRSDGQSWRPFLPLADFADALSLAALGPPSLDDGLPLWNIASPELQMTVAEAATRAARAARAMLPVFGAGSMPDRRSYRVAGARFTQAYPGFRYDTDFDALIAATVAAYHEIPTLAHDLAAGRFIRLAQLDQRHLMAGPAKAVRRAG